MYDLPYPKRIRIAREAYANPDNVFHIVTRAMPETIPFRARVGTVVWDAIRRELDRNSVVVIAACLMPDHLHLLVRPQERSVVAWMNAFKSLTTHLARKEGHGSRLWQPSFYDRHVRELEFQPTLSYIMENPVAGGLVGRSEDWPWLFYDEGAG